MKKITARLGSLSLVLTMACSPTMAIDVKQEIAFERQTVGEYAVSTDNRVIVNDTFDKNSTTVVDAGADLHGNGGYLFIKNVAPNQEKNFATVAVENEQTGNKAIKIVKNNEVSNANVLLIKDFYDGGNLGVKGDILHLSYQYRVETPNNFGDNAFEDFGNVKCFKEATHDLYYLGFLAGGANAFHLGGLNEGDGIKYWFYSRGDDLYKWYKIDVIANMKTNTYNFYVNGELKSVDSGSDILIDKGRWGAEGLERLLFSIRTSPNVAGKPDGTLWIDDIVLETLAPLSMTSATPENNATGVSIGPKLSLNFDRNLNSGSANNTAVKVYKGATQLNSSDYNVSVSKTDSKSLIIDFNKDLDYKTTYTVKVQKTLKAALPQAATPMGEIVYTFTTESPNFLIDEFNGNMLPEGWAVVENGSNDSATVENGKLKLVKGDNGKLVVKRTNPLVTADKKMMVEFDAIFENHNRAVTKFPAIMANDNLTVATLGSAINSSYLTQTGDKSITKIENVDFSSQKVYNIRYVIDPVTDTQDIYVDDMLTHEAYNIPLANNVNVNGIGDMVFEIETGEGSTNEVIYIDNFKIMPVKDALVIDSTTPLDGAKDINIKTAVKVAFNIAINPISINDITVSTAQGTVNTKKRLENAKTLVIEFPDNMTKNTQYTVNIPKGLKDARGGALLNDYVFSFTTNNKDAYVYVDDTFESGFTTGGTIAENGWSVSGLNAENGDSVKVAFENENNKAIKFTKGNNNPKLGYTLNLTKTFDEPIHGDYIILSYRMKMAGDGGFNKGDGLRGFGDVKGINDIGETNRSYFMCESYYEDRFDMWIKGNYTSGIGGSGLLNSRGSWAERKIIFNTVNNSFNSMFATNGDPLTSRSNGFIDYETTIDSITSLEFPITIIPEKNVTSTDIVYWIDDLKVEVQDALNVKEVNITSDNNGILTKPSASVVFNKEINSSTINDIKVITVENNVQLPLNNKDYSVLLNKTDNKVVDIIFNKDLGYFKEYKIVVGTNVLNATEPVGSLTNAYEYSFTTKPTAFDATNIKVKNLTGAEVTDLSTVKGQKINVSATFRNNYFADEQPYVFIIAIKDKDNKLLSAKCYKSKIYKGSTEVMTKQIDVPSEASSTDRVEVLVWNSFNNTIPLSQKYIK